MNLETFGLHSNFTCLDWGIVVAYMPGTLERDTAMKRSRERPASFRKSRDDC